MEGITYDYLFREIADKRVENWSLMKDASYPIGIIGLYLVLIYIVLPSFVRNRKAYDLKGIIQTYNVFQIVSCSYVLYGFLTAGWTSGKMSLGCQPVDYSHSYIGTRQVKFLYYTFLLKVTDLTETIIFVLRKKQNQVTFLHIYHHCSMVFISWIACKYYGGGMTVFPVMLNAGVHVLMYMYYFVAALGPKYQNKLGFIKPKLTMLQMTQFTIIILHSLQVFQEGCTMPTAGPCILMSNVIVIFMYFINFYIKQYKKKK